MRLILDLFRRIFEALQGVYTKAETDAALAERDNRIANAEENIGLNAEAVEQLDEALEANTANDNALANVVKWQSYAAAMQSAVDEITAAQIAEEFGRATVEYLADPTKTKEWYTSSTTESTNPYFSTPPTKPVVDFNVVKVSRGAVAVGSFNANTNVPIFLPNATNCESAFYLLKKLNSLVILPAATSLVQAFYGASLFDKILILPNAINCRSMLQTASSFSKYAILPKCSNAASAFSRTKMSAENISKTLDSLPTWTDGASHVVTFTGSPGASELTQDSPSVAAAVARGWTVEL